MCEGKPAEEGVCAHVGGREKALVELETSWLLIGLQMERRRGFLFISSKRDHGDKDGGMQRHGGDEQ